MKRILTIFSFALATTLAAQDASTILKKSEAYLRGAQSTAEGEHYYGSAWLATYHGCEALEQGYRYELHLNYWT